MKDWEDIIKERQLSRKAELPESDWNDFLSGKAAHERAAIHRRKLNTLFISVPAAAAVLLLLFLMPFKTVVPDNQIAQNEPSEPQITADSIANPLDSVAVEKPQVEIAQVKPQVKPKVKPDVEPKVNTEFKLEAKPEITPQVKPEVRTGMTFGGATGFGGSTSQHYGSRMIAQNTGSVKGRIYDFDSTEPMYPASLLVYQITGTDSTFVRATTTDEDGSFVIDSLGTGNYLARATYIGFHDSDKNFTISSGDATEDLGDIALRYDEMYAQNIQAVVSKVSTGGMNNDTAMFNMTAYRLSEGTSVEDLVRKLPGVQIDSAGNITVNGKSVSRILVNGKEFFNDDKTKSLTQLTAEMIEKVKAYEKNSDLSRQTGIDDGREVTVMDIPSKDTRGLMIKGSVWDFDTAEPLDNACVQLYRVTRKDSTLISSTFTGQDGSFVFYNLKRGKYVVRASLDDYYDGESSYKIRRSGSRINDIGIIPIRRVGSIIYENPISISDNE